MADKTLWCLHGNLQQPDVWHGLAQALSARDQKLQIQRVSLWDTLENNCWAWAEQFCQTVQSATVDQNYLLGYSLGGRLAWHALIAQPNLWAGAVIISADPGMTNGLQKEQCLQRDRIWASRFIQDPWHDLLAAWDALPVFCHRPCLITRREDDFDRRKIAHAFEAYSKGHMDDLTQQLQTLNMPITYVTGSEDRRYCQLGHTLSQQCPQLRHKQVQAAGHRVPWERPDATLSILIDALSSRK